MVDDLKAHETHFSGISAFDLDHTLISGNSSYLFGRYLFRRRILSFFDLAFIVKCNLMFKIGRLPIKALHRAAFDKLFKGRRVDDVELWAAAFIEESFESLLYKPAVEALNHSITQGQLAAILSSSPDFLISPIAAKLNVTVWDATRYAVDKDRRFCDIHRLVLGSDKALLLEKLRVQHGVPLRDVYAYSDSHLDLPFLEAAGNAVGVNPNRRLLEVCRCKKWQVI